MHIDINGNLMGFNQIMKLKINGTLMVSLI